MNENTQLDKYAESTIASGSRTRKIVYFIAFTSIVGFMAAWNTRPNSWVDSRYKMVNDAMLVYGELEDSTKIPIYGGTTKISNYKTSPTYLQLATDSVKRDSIKSNVDDFITSRRIRNVGELRALKGIYVELKRETFDVTVPIFGVSFDINDLGIFSGLTLTLLLTLLWFTMRREKENLVFTLHTAAEKSKENLESCYNYLAMSQIITYPPRLHSERSYAGKSLTKLIYLLPLFTQLFIFIIDMSTLSYGSSLDPSLKKVYSLIFFDGLFFGAIAIISIVCLSYAWKIDRTWEHYLETILEGKLIKNA